jgi:hypothetical protein
MTTDFHQPSTLQISERLKAEYIPLLFSNAARRLSYEPMRVIYYLEDHSRHAIGADHMKREAEGTARCYSSRDKYFPEASCPRTDKGLSENRKPSEQLTLSLPSRAPDI